MLWWLLNKWEDRHLYEIVVVFANTGKEVEGTLFFVDEVAQEFNIPIVWVEGYPSNKINKRTNDSCKGWSAKDTSILHYLNYINCLKMENKKEAKESVLTDIGT